MCPSPASQIRQEHGLGRKEKDELREGAAG
jgi:hypothetical protein